MLKAKKPTKSKRPPPLPTKSKRPPPVPPPLPKRRYGRAELVAMAQRAVRSLGLPPQIQAVVIVVDGSVGDYVGVASTADPAYTQQMLECAATPVDHREGVQIIETHGKEAP